jgi:DNA-binding YbaB/EbfC family protein
MQQKLAEAQAELAEAMFEGKAGGELVRLSLKGSGELVALALAPELLAEGDAETLADLVLAAHRDARFKLEQASSAVMQKAMGPLAGMAGMKGFGL